MTEMSEKSVVLKLFFAILASRQPPECHQWFSNCLKPFNCTRKVF